MEVAQLNAIDLLDHSLKSHASLLNGFIKVLGLTDKDFITQQLNGLQGASAQELPWITFEVLLAIKQRQDDASVSASIARRIESTQIDFGPFGGPSAALPEQQQQILQASTEEQVNSSAGCLLEMPATFVSSSEDEPHDSDSSQQLSTAASQKQRSLPRAIPALFTHVQEPCQQSYGPSKLNLTLTEVPNIGAGFTAFADDDVRIHIDTGTSPSLIRKDVFWRLAEEKHRYGLPYELIQLNEPVVLAGVGDGTVYAWEVLRTHFRIGRGLYYLTFFVVDDLPEECIMGMGQAKQWGIRFNHHRSTVRLRLPRANLAPDSDLPVDCNGRQLTIQWVPMQCRSSTFKLF